MIRGSFLVSGEVRYACVASGMSVPALGSGFAPLAFVIDTGAPYSVLHPRDISTAFGLADDAQSRVVANQTRVGMAGGIGGSAMYAELPATFVLVHADGRVDLHEQTVLVTNPTPANRELPSLLGMDVLQHYRLTLTGTQSVTLESLAELGLAAS